MTEKIMEGGAEKESVPLSSSQLKALDCKNSGNEKFKHNDFKGAICDYKKGLLYEPTNCDLHANLAAAYIYLEKNVEAEEHAVFAMHLRPTFYKGYWRAAKAAHAKGMTKLSLKRLDQGLTNVTDPVGIKELARLKKQYTAYLSLKINAEREIDINYAINESGDEEQQSDIDEYDDDDDEDGDASLPLEFPKPLDKNNLAKIWDSKLPLTDSMANTTAQMVNVMTTVAERAISRQKHASKDKPATKEKATVNAKEPQTANTIEKTEETKDKLDQTSLKNKEKSEPEEVKDPKEAKLEQNLSELKLTLSSGTVAFHQNNFRMAAETFKAAKERVGTQLTDYDIDERQLNVIKYAYSAALINSNNYDDIVNALNELNSLESYKENLPALYIQMARAYCRLNRFKKALEPLEKLQEIIDNCPIFPTFNWPGTDDKIIEETTPNGLKNSMKDVMQQTRLNQKPTAICRFENCLKISTHILPSTYIYNSDLDFIGYVQVVCDDKCHIEFHLACWKSYKETVTGGRMNDKDFLGQPCVTTDCTNADGEPSAIVSIEVYGADGQLKTANKIDANKTAAAVDSKKSKKRKGKQGEKEGKEKEKEKEKAEKAMKKEKREEKKVVEKSIADDLTKETVTNSKEEDPEKEIQMRMESSEQLRKLKFGSQKNWFDPSLQFFGREEEALKAATGVVWEPSANETSEVKVMKEFFFSYFLSTLKEEGPQTLKEIDDLWKESSENFCDIKSAMPNMRSMAHLLLESPRFCQIEDYICLTDQLDEAHGNVEKEVRDLVNYVIVGNTSLITENQEERDGSAERYDKEDGSLSDDESVEEDSDQEYCSEPDSDQEDGDEDFLNDLELQLQRDVPEFEFDQQVADESDNDSEEKYSDEDPIRVQTSKTSEPEEKFSIRNLLSEMSSLKLAMTSAATSDTKVNTESEGNEAVESVASSNDTAEFASAEGSPESMGLTCGPHKLMTHDEAGEYQKTPHHQSLPSVRKTKPLPPSVEAALTKQTEDKENDEDREVKEQKPSGHPKDSSSQNMVVTQSKQIQTQALEFKDMLSQTKELDMTKEYKLQIQELNKKLEASESLNNKLKLDLEKKENQLKQTKAAKEEAIANNKESNRKQAEMMKSLQAKIADLMKKEALDKRTIDELTRNLNKEKACSTTALNENNHLKDINASLIKENSDLKAKLTSTINLNKDNEKKALQNNRNQLIAIKTYWDSHISMLKKRCVEKISEMQSFFQMIPPEEVEGLPSMAALYHATQQWKEITNKLQQIEPIFQSKYASLDASITNGEVVDNLTLAILPPLPEEPSPLSLDKITRELTEKYVKRNIEMLEKITKLTQLVANQQLEIETKKSNQTPQQQFQSMMSTFPLQPRLPTPMSTSFAGLSQFMFPQNIPPPSPFNSTQPTKPPQNIQIAASAQEPVTSLNQTNFAEAIPLSQDNNSSVSFGALLAAKPQNGEDGVFPSDISFMGPPIDVAPPHNLVFSQPPLHGVAHKVMQAAASEQVKELKQPERTVTPKSESSASRDSTPQRVTPVPTPVPQPTRGQPPSQTPEKPKKKKKAKSESKELPLNVPVSSSTTGHETNGEIVYPPSEPDEWNVVGVHKSKSVNSVTESKALKTKKKLLEKLLIRNCSVSMKEMDEIMKKVRDSNNGTLSGLAYAEIENRVDRVLAMKGNTRDIGMFRFLDAPWGNLAKQDARPKPNLQLEECIVCLEAMTEKSRTKLDCNHEFHTHCLRQWLREKRVCPLCNKFAAMPDEFPAL